jgi:hypothetical protein
MTKFKLLGLTKGNVIKPNIALNENYSAIFTILIKIILNEY